MRVVPAATAHQVTAIGMVHQRLIANAPLSPDAAGARVRFAVVGGFLDVHQIRVHGLAVRVWFFDLEKGRPFVACGFHWLHVDSAGVFVFEDESQLPKLRQGRPAGSGGTGARHAMAFTLQTHVPLQDLHQEQHSNVDQRI